jgi:hypothetical protein
MGRERMHWFDRVSGYAKDPRAEEREPEEVQSEHESYGVIEISNPSGPDRFLFGSSIPHMHSIEMTVKRARLYRDHGDRTYGHAVLLKIEMSHSQFVEMMTSTGKGSGTPVTLRYVNGKRMEDPPFTSKRRQHDQEFRLRMRNFVRDLDQNNIEVGEILEKPSISKTDRAALRSAYDRIVAEVRSNIPFFVEQFNEQMDKTVMESTSEIEAFVEGKIRQLGLERFQDEVKGMILGGSTETKELTD